MKITFYGYNTFVVQSKGKKIVIDPGAELYLFQFRTILPKSEWQTITHIFVTHGDPDHHWHTDRVSATSNTPIICNKTMIKVKNGSHFMLGPRSKGLAFTMPVDKFYSIAVGETIQVDGMHITGIRTTHGSLTFKLGPISKTVTPGPTERIGWGAIGFQIQLDNKTIINLGDTLLHKDEWKTLKDPDVLMIPIGGHLVHNTMDEIEALEAVKMMKPKLVIPCHYNCPGFLKKNSNYADDKMFKEEVEKMGIKCIILKKGDSTEI